ncbi:MAG: hypothetical protein II889_10330 [Clostridia bacterium]|nr:hypothetical protein [Clostridia bacterium]
MKKLALVLALALAVILAVSAAAADPVISIDFADGAGDVELVNAEIVNDVTRGNVLKVNGQGNGTARTSYGLYKTDVFENTDWEKGLTVSLWIQTDVGSDNLSGTAPIFSIDSEAAPQGYIAAVCSLETTMNTDGNQPETGITPRCWNDPVNVSGGMNKTDEGLWELLTVVYDPDSGNIYMYLNDELVNTQTLGGGSIDMFLFELEFYNLVRLGAWNCVWWNYGDYQGLIDDVNIYAEALTEDDVADLYSATKVTQTVVVKAPSVEDLYTAEDHTPVYTLDFEDASALELNNAEIVPGHTGNALKVKGEGDGTNGTSYGLVTTDLFKNTDWTGGMTISMWVNADSSDTLNGMAPLYSLDIARIGYIGVVNSLQSGINTDGNEDVGIVPRFWNDPGNRDGCVNETTAGQWDLVTVVYNNDGANNMAIYKNGEVVVKPGINLGTAFGDGTNEQFFTEQLKEVYSLRLGSWLCDWWNYGDYQGLIDDVEIYNVALNPLEVKYLFTGKPAAEGPAEVTVVQSLDLNNKSEFEQGEEILVSAYTDGAATDAGNKDWVGIYHKDDVPGDNASLAWYYVAENGNYEKAVDIAAGLDLEPGEYKVCLFANDGYDILLTVDLTVKASEAAEPAEEAVEEPIMTEPEEEAVQEEVTVSEELEKKEEAPQTFDFGVIALVVSALSAGAALTFRKRK